MNETIDIQILQLLLQATQKNMISWVVVEDDDLDMYSSQLGDDLFEVELINLQRSGETTCEKALARIQSKKIYQTYAIGTEGYELITAMLSESVFGWEKSRRAYNDNLLKLKKRIETRITEQNN